MRTMTLGWKRTVANGEFKMESKVRIYGATGSDPNGTAGSDSRGSYKEYATITAPIITRALLPDDSISVGNTISSRLNFTLMTTDTIPKSAMILVLGSAYDAQYSSGLFYFGTYWIDHRTVNDDLIDIEAYDAMKKGNQVYSDDSSTMSWPKTIQTVVNRIASQMGVSLDSTVTALFRQVGSLNIVTKPNDDMVLLDILKYLGEVLGGNWIITDLNQLRFVALTSPPNETNYIIDEAHNFITTEQGDYLIHTGESQAHEGQTHPVSGFGTSYVPVVLGSITTASKYTISKVTIALDSDHVYTYGDDTGFHLIASESNPYASDAMAQLLYSRVNGVTYAPFEITNSVYDPATELGDWVVAGSVYGVLYNEKRVLDVGFYGDMSAPGRDEMEDEYPYQTFAQKTQYQIDTANKSIDEANANIDVLSSEISQMPDSILLRVSQVYETKTHSAENLQTAKSYADGVGADAIDQADDNTDTKLQSYYTKTETESKISTEIGKIDLSVYETKTQSKTYYDNAIAYADDIGSDANDYADSVGANAITTAGTNTDNKLVNYYTKTEADSRISVEIGKIDLSVYETKTQAQTYYQNGKDYTDTQVSSAEGRIKLTTDAIEASVSNKVGNDEIRSKFALDKTNITLSAGVDGSGNPTGTITFNAGTLLVNSTNFTLDSNGHLSCYGATIGSTGYNSDTQKNNTITIENGYISGHASNLNDKCLIEFDSIGTTSGQSYSFMKINAPYIDMSANVGYTYVYGKEQANISAGSRNSYGRTPCEIDLNFGGTITIRGYSVQINDNSSQYLGLNGYIYMLTDLNGGWAQYKVVNGFIVQ